MLALSYNSYPNSEDIISYGFYHKYNWGGCTTWFLLKKELDYFKPDYTYLIYQDEKYLYVFDFYNINEDSLLKLIFNNNLFNTVYIKDNSIYCLSNNKINNYNIHEEYIFDIDGNIIENDQLGGSLLGSLIK